MTRCGNQFTNKIKHSHIRNANRGKIQNPLSELIGLGPSKFDTQTTVTGKSVSPGKVLINLLSKDGIVNQVGSTKKEKKGKKEGT